MEPNSRTKFNKSKLLNGTKPSNQKNKPNETNTQQPQQRNKKAKRLPWNTDVLYDRITPQPYQVQIIDECTSQQNQNSIIFMKTDEWKNYYKMMIIKQFALKTISIKKLFILIYCSFLNIGIVQPDGRYLCLTIQQTPPPWWSS